MSSVRRQVTTDIIVTWIITIPASALVAALGYFVVGLLG